jgi:RNA polymerase sigma-70 factor, ECF subfamily
MGSGSFFRKPAIIPKGRTRVTPSETTRLLRAWAKGDQAALNQLTPLVYKELKRIAGHYMRYEQPGRTMQATALVHEAFIKLMGGNFVAWEHRAHFFAVAAKIMRQILLDSARKKATAKHGGERVVLNLDLVSDLSTGRSNELLALDAALTELENVDERRAKVIELRFFGGLTVEETAKVLQVSPDTVMRDWRLARAWLASEITGR